MISCLTRRWSHRRLALAFPLSRLTHIAGTTSPPAGVMLQQSSLAFTNGTSRGEIIRQVKQANGTIIKDSPDRLRVELFQATKTEPAVRVDITFVDGKLSKVDEVRE